MSNLMWGMMVNLGYNMWKNTSDTLRLDKEVWDYTMLYMQNMGVNMLLVDIAEGLKYECHPELSAKDAWSREYFLEEMKKLRDMGFEIVPKLNFSACHDFWLKDYSRMISTPAYYDACKSLIDEICQILKPKYFHLGMDEEDYTNQRNMDYVFVRQNDLWWHDLYFLQNCVEKNGARAWVWSDYICDHKDEFLRKMPKEIVQCNWYYGEHFDLDSYRAAYPGIDESYVLHAGKCIEAFGLLAEKGYQQVPTGSNWFVPENMRNLVKYCRQNVDQTNILGYLQTPWKPMIDDFRPHQLSAVYLLRQAMNEMENK